MTMKSQAERVTELLRERGVPDRKMRSALADVCGIRYQSVKGWFDGTTKTITADNLAKIATHWKASLEWLVSGTGTMNPAPDFDELVRYASGYSNADNVADATPYVPATRLAPVISWVKAGDWHEAEDPFEPGVAEEWEPVPDSAGPHAFWLSVVGDSMTAPHGPSIPEGMLILVDPDYPAVSGRLVVAKLTDSNQVTFKKLVEDAGQRFLKPLNPSYPAIQINGNCRIVGAVREAKIKF